MEELLQVNHALCAKCGICAEVCPRRIIGVGLEGPETHSPQSCIACGHCVAVCPRAALDHTKAPLADQEPLLKIPVLDAKTAAQFLRSRRSIRRYRKETPSRATILQLLEIARFAPTAINSQGLSYQVIVNPGNLKDITAAVIDWLEERGKNDTEWADRYASIVRPYRETGSDRILRDAPCLIVAVAPQDFPFGSDNALFSLEYVELYAAALGLGTCWAGYVMMCAGAGCPPLRTAMRIPEGMKVVGVMMAGYPEYIYQRLVDREPLQVTWI